MTGGGKEETGTGRVSWGVSPVPRGESADHWYCTAMATLPSGTP